MVVLDLKTGEAGEGKGTKMRVKQGRCGGKKEVVCFVQPKLS